jgi:hypothetical protein
MDLIGWKKRGRRTGKGGRTGSWGLPNSRCQTSHPLG